MSPPPTIMTDSPGMRSPCCCSSIADLAVAVEPAALLSCWILLLLLLVRFPQRLPLPALFCECLLVPEVPTTLPLQLSQLVP